MTKTKHGGARPGAGRKPKLRLVQAGDTSDGNQVGAAEFLLTCVNDKSLDAALRIKAAGTLLADGRRGKVEKREQAEAENLASVDMNDSWQTRLMEELSNEKTTAH